jgi:ATP-dependent helicase HrpB
VDLLPLHGSLNADAQDRAIGPGPRRRVVFATNIAETSLTVPGVSIVIDTGLQKVARYDAERAIDTLVLERVTDDSATQRAGRAARLGPGVAKRLWDSRDRLRAAREPEIHRVDLAGVLLNLIAVGHRPAGFPWFEAPEPGRVDAALVLLERLGALDGTTITPMGDQLRRFPMHPRFGRVLMAAHGAWEAAAACAWLSEGRGTAQGHAATSCDLLPLIDRWSSAPPHTRLVADTLYRTAQGLLGIAARPHVDERLHADVVPGVGFGLDPVYKRREPAMRAARHAADASSFGLLESTKLPPGGRTRWDSLDNRPSVRSPYFFRYVEE